MQYLCPLLILSAFEDAEDEFEIFYGLLHARRLYWEKPNKPRKFVDYIRI